MAQLSVKDYPVIGEPMPEFSLTNVNYYSKGTFNSKDLKGKWVIMDFWSKACVVCIQSFPKVNQLQNEFKDQVQFMLVAKNDKKYNNNIEQIYDRYKEKLGLQLSIAYDSVIFKQFKIQGVPHIIVIDPQSTVYALTSTEFLNRENLKALIENKKPGFKRMYYDFEENPVSNYVQWKYSVDEKDLEPRDFLYRSILSGYSGEPISGSWQIDQHVAKGFYQVIRANLFELYNLAYLGEGSWGRRGIYFTHWKYPILEISDTSLFQFNPADNTGFYNYSLIVPREKASKEYLMELMQRDLKNYFGYEVFSETRMMPCWKLTSTEEARINLKTRSENRSGDFGPAGISGKKITIEEILGQIEWYNSDELIPFFDETGIKGRIDISFSAAMTELDDVKKSLRKAGLILGKAEKEMKVLVIRNKKD